MKRIPFTITQHGYTYGDALFVEDETPEQIEAMKQARFDNWYKIITTPVENPNPEEFVEEVVEEVVEETPIEEAE
jgi:hypothetical protein